MRRTLYTERMSIMFNATAHTNSAAPATTPSFLFWIIETLLTIHLRDDLAADDVAGQAHGAYHYGL